MTWVAIIELILKAVAGVSQYLSNRQLIESGKAQIINDGLSEILESIGKSNAAQQDIIANPDSEFASSVRKKYERGDT